MYSLGTSACNISVNSTVDIKSDHAVSVAAKRILPKYVVLLNANGSIGRPRQDRKSEKGPDPVWTRCLAVLLDGS